MGAIVQWEEMVSRVESGDIESLNISREQILESQVSIGMAQYLVPKRFNHQHSELRSNSRVIIIKDGGLQVNEGLKSADPGKKATSYVFGDKDCIVSPTHSCEEQGVIYKI